MRMPKATTSSDGRYEVIGLPGRNIIARRSEIRRYRGCVGASTLKKGDEAAPVTIRLQPWSAIVGRIIDNDGQPCRGLDMMGTGGSYPARPDVQGVLPADEPGNSGASPI
jgi:hypothetical protein